MSTSLPTSPALARLISVPGIAAAFVFSESGTLLAREVPEKYANESLERIAQGLLKMAQAFACTSTLLLHLEFDNFSVLLKGQGATKRFYLALFVERKTDLELLTQPVNLAVLNLEKMVRAYRQEMDEQAQQSDLAKAARSAELSLFQNSGEDTNRFYARLSVLVTYFIGFFGQDILLQGCHKLQLTLPMCEQEKMRALVNYCAENIANAEAKEHFKQQCDDLILQTLWQASPSLQSTK